MAILEEAENPVFDTLAKGQPNKVKRVTGAGNFWEERFDTTTARRREYFEPTRPQVLPLED